MFQCCMQKCVQCFFTILISIHTKLSLHYHLHKAVDHNSANFQFFFTDVNITVMDKIFTKCISWRNSFI